MEKRVIGSICPNVTHEPNGAENATRERLSFVAFPRRGC